MTDLSIIIPARNEIFLAKTIEDIYKNKRGDTEVIAILDGEWANPPIPDTYDNLTLIYHSDPIGQRATVNEGVKISTAKYVMKADAHCAFDEGFDVKMMEGIQDDWTFSPVMRNLHAFNWVCPKGHERYQGPSGNCVQVIDPENNILCDLPTTMDVVWIPKVSPQSRSFCFNSEPKFQYFNDYIKRPGFGGDYTESMSLQGSCWMLTRKKYLELDVCDESFGIWGSQGIEVAVKTWLSGGRVMINNKTWYAHMFRTQGGDFGFPYPLGGGQVDRAKKKARELFFYNQWDKQEKPLSWLVRKFWPVNGWSDDDLKKIEPSKEIIYYTCNSHKDDIEQACRKQLLKAKGDIPIVSVSLNKEIDFGDKRIVIEGNKGSEMLHKQILAGLEASTADYIFFCENDLLYHPNHFLFIPPSDDVFYYNEHTYKVDYETGQAVFYYTKQTSGLCANRQLLLEHYKKRLKRIEEEGKFDRKIGYEPGCHQFPRGVDDKTAMRWMSKNPNIDIRHDKNFTLSKWSLDDFRDKRTSEGWSLVDEIPGWGITKGRFQEFFESFL